MGAAALPSTGLRGAAWLCESRSKSISSFKESSSCFAFSSESKVSVRSQFQSRDKRTFSMPDSFEGLAIRSGKARVSLSAILRPILLMGILAEPSLCSFRPPTRER
jgi:hypothetical protein